MVKINSHCNLKSLAEVLVAAAVLFTVHMKRNSNRKRKIKKEIPLETWQNAPGKIHSPLLENLALLCVCVCMWVLVRSPVFIKILFSAQAVE